MKKETVILLKEKLERFNITSDITEDMLFKRDHAHLKCNNCNSEFTRSLRSLDSCTITPCENCRFKEKFLKNLLEKYERVPYTFLEEIKDYDTKILVKCVDCGYEDKLSPRNMLSNFRYPKLKHPCKGCAYKRNYIKTDATDLKNILKKKFKKVNYKIINTNKYISAYAPTSEITVQCKFCKDIMTVKSKYLVNSKKHYCPKCNNLKRDKRSYEDRLFEKHHGNIVNLESYKTLKTPIKHECKVCGYGSNGEWLSPPADRLSGRGCPKCSKLLTRSSGESELTEFIKKIYKKEVILNSRDILENKQEIDIYLPDIKVGIEYCGLYWHNEKHKGKSYHKNKYKQATIQNIRLIQVFEDEWIYKKDIVKSKILHILKLENGEKIYARNCKIKEITQEEKRKFLNENHIQGNDRSTLKFGLFYGNTLASVMTFGKRRIPMVAKNQIKEDVYELVRFASLKNKIVIGAFGKLFSYFLENHPDVKEIVTYADLRWSSESNVYEKIGFIKYNETAANYFYVSRNSGTQRLYRYNFRKQVLKTKFPDIYRDDLTEFQIMDKTKKYYRIFDAGNLSYKYIIS